MVFDKMIMRLFVLRIGKADYCIAYGVFTPCLKVMSEPVISQASHKGRCEHGKLYLRKVIFATDKDVIMGIFDDLAKGISLKTSFVRWGVSTKDMDFDVKYSLNTDATSCGSEQIVERQLANTKSYYMLEPELLFAKDGKVPNDIDQAIRTLEDYLKNDTQLPFGGNFGHLGNLDVIIPTDRDPNGKPLVECRWKKGNPFVQNVKVKKELTDGNDEVIVNIRFTGDGKILSDSILHDKPSGVDMDFHFSIDTCPSTVEIKVWLRKENENKLVHQSLYYIVSKIHVSIAFAGDKLKVTSDWMDKIRKTLSSNNQGAADKAEIIEHKSKEEFTIGSKSGKSAKNIRQRPKVKINDVFFPKGWDETTETQGMLSFLSWFKNKANGAKSVFLQDPYFEEVALFFIASAETDCEYTVLTQTQLKTNTDGTSFFDEGHDPEPGDRKSKIVNGIKANPQMFAPMKLIVVDVPASAHNALHDRYMVFDYGGVTEGYMLSNSLQGATSKQPLLITQIGDNAFEKVKEHIEEAVYRKGNEVIYDYSQERGIQAEELTKRREVADDGFEKWLITQRDELAIGDVGQILQEIRTWRTWDRLATLGHFLANTNPSVEYKIFEHIVSEMRKDIGWIEVLKNFILTGHYSPFPVGYIKCPRWGYIHTDSTRLLSLEYDEIMTPYNVHIIDGVRSDSHCFFVYGQYYAAKMLIRLSASDAIDVLKKLRPTLIDIKTDKTITPVYKVTLMLLSELLNSSTDDEVMKAFLSDGEEWCRALGALMLLHRTVVSETFKVEDYRAYFGCDDELITLCHTAWAVKPEPHNKQVFYEWLLEVFKRTWNAGLFTCQYQSLMQGVHFAEDKVEYIENVALPLVDAGLVKKDELSTVVIESIYEKCISGNSVSIMRDSLVDCLYVIDGDIQILYDQARETVEKFKNDMMKMAVPNGDDIFKAAFSCIELRIMLKRLICRYADRTSNPVICNLQTLLGEIDHELDERGQSDTKKMFED